MGKGLSVPVKTSPGGGAKLEDDPQHLSTVLRLALSIGEDDNPFQNLGMDKSSIFAINDASAKALAENNIRKILNKFSDRLKLDENKPITFDQNTEGELQVNFGFINFDTGESENFTTTIG